MKDIVISALEYLFEYFGNKTENVPSFTEDDNEDRTHYT
jgi:hypothetical protein